MAFSDTRNWLQLMVGVHRYFFSSIVTATEAGLVILCRERGVEVRTWLEQETQDAIQQIERECGDRPNVQRAIKRLRAKIRSKKPEFSDYLKGALSTVVLPDPTRAKWLKFFAALSVVRNKASHSDVTLTDAERQRLVEGGLMEGGCAAMVSPAGELTLNPRMYHQVASLILEFFDLLCNDTNVINPSAPPGRRSQEENHTSSPNAA